MESCNDLTDQSQCNAEPIGVDGLYCFKANFENEDLEDGEHPTECMTFPIDPNNQKIYFQFINGILKESYSSYGKLPRDADYDFFESQIWKSNKESYSKDETIQIGPGQFSSVDKTILKSEQTCSYYYYGRYYKSQSFYGDEGPNRNYDNIRDKNICYNAKKFNEFKNLIDCGYAEIRVNYGGTEYNINTCYLIPTANLPEMFKEPYSSYQKQVLIDFMLNDIISGMSGENIGGDDDDGRRIRRRRLQTDLTFEINVENKYGRKITFSSDNVNSFTVNAPGVPGPDETLDSENKSKASYIGINLILLILLFGL